MSTRLRHYRDLSGLTLEDVAARIGMTAGNLSRLERGLIPYAQPALEALALVYGCRVADLVDEDPQASLIEDRLRARFRRLSPEDQARLLQIAAVLADSGLPPGLDEPTYPAPGDPEAPTFHEPLRILRR